MADPGSHPDGDAQDLVEPGLAERADALVARGLERYGEGDLEGALSEWEHARALVPECAAAEEYIQYVRDNFDLLDEQFQHAREVAHAASEAGVPLGEDAEADGGGDYGYEELEVTSSDAVARIAGGDNGLEPEDGDTTQGPAVAPIWGAVVDDESSVDDGWSLDATAAPVEGDAEGDADAAAAEEPATPAVASTSTAAADSEAEDSGAPPPDAGAQPVSTRPASSFDLSSVSSAMLDLDHLPQGYRLRPGGGPLGSGPTSGNDDEQTVPGGRTPPPLAEHAAISQDVLDAIDSVAAELEREQAAEVAKDDRQRDDSGDREDTADFDQNRLAQLDGSSDFQRSDTKNPVPVSVTFHDVGTSEKTMPSRPSAASIDFAGLDLGADESVDIDDLPSAADLQLDREERSEDEESTRERAGVVASWQDFGSPGLLDEAASDDEATRQRTFTGSSPQGQAGEPSGADGQLDDQLLSATAPRPDLDEPAIGPGPEDGEPVDLESETRKLVAVQPLALTGFGGAVTPDNVDAIAQEFRDGLDEGAPTGESESDRQRRRVLGLLDQARTEDSASRPMLAAVLAELAQGEAPDSAVGQKLVHQHRSVLLAVFRTFVGDPSGVPMVTVPMHQVAELDIDSRAAFLLSRIDGTLSFEEILDVCGMPELEAYGHITRLLVTGIVEVR